MFFENWELSFKFFPSLPFNVSWEELGARLVKTLEPGIYWKVQPSASGSFLWSFPAMHAGLGDISHIYFPATAGVGSHQWLIMGCLNEEQSRLLGVRAEGFLETTLVWTFILWV